MHLPTLRARRAVNRTLESLADAGPRPRETAIEFLRSKIADGDASLDTADPAVFHLDANAFEKVWATAVFNLCGQLQTVRPSPRGEGWRLTGLLEADVRYELGLDTDETAAPLTELEFEQRRLEVVRDAIARLEDPTPPAMRDQMLAAQHAAAVRVDCECGAPAGLECRCTDEQRLATTPERQVH